MLWAGLHDIAGAAPRSLGQEAACGVRAEQAPNASNTVCGVCAPDAQELGQLRKCPHGYDRAGHLLRLRQPKLFVLLERQGFSWRVRVQKGRWQRVHGQGLLRR